MNCKEVRRYINLFIDSELDSKTNFEVSEHLSSCEDCSKRFAQEERIEKLFVSVLKEEKDPKSSTSFVLKMNTETGVLQQWYIIYAVETPFT